MNRLPMRRERFGLLGVAAAGCIACCAGPVLAFLGGLSLAGLSSSLVIGTTGLLIATVAAAAWVLVRTRNRKAPPTVTSEPVPVAAPTRRP